MLTLPRSLVVAATVACCGVLSPEGKAQWSHNRAANLGVSVRGSDQNQPKIAPTSDGGSYVVWLDGIGIGWDTRLQRLNARGVPQWPGNGVLVANTSFSSTEDYGIAVDTSNNAIIAYRDDSTGTVQVEAQKVDTNGNLLWNAAGIQVSNGASNAPHVCVLTYGNIDVMWTQSPGIRVQKLEPVNGNIQFATGGIVENPASSFYLGADVQAGDSGSIITSWIKFTQRHLYAQKFNSAGTRQWNSGNPLIVFDGSALANGYQPPFVGDGSGGAIFSWYDLRGTNPLNVRVQHVSAAGAELFGHNGQIVSTNTADRYRSNPSAAYNAATGDIYVFWSDTALPTTLNQWGVAGQKLDAAGNRAWGDGAVSYIPLNGLQNSFVRTVALTGGGAMYFCIDRAGSGAHIVGGRVDSNGATLWTPAVLDASSTGSGKSRLFAAPNAAGTQSLLTWGDARTDANDIYAQNVNLDGSIGNPGDVNDDGSVNVNDLLAVITTWGACPAPPPPATFCPADIAPPPQGDGQINVNDLLAVISHWD